jgi:hypothetical protein
MKRPPDPVAFCKGRIDMKRLIGVALFTLGALPLVLVMAGWVMWMDHMYTVGLSLGAVRALVALLMADIVCLSARTNQNAER